MAQTLNNKIQSRPLKSEGFSLVELMVGLALSTVVLGALIAVFVGFHSASGTTSGISTLTDNGRFALNYVEQSVRSAGFLACSTSKVSNNLLPQGSSAIYYNFSQAMQGFEATSSAPGGTVTLSATPTAAQATPSLWTPSLDAHLTADMATPGVVAGSDIIVIRESAQNAQQPTTYVTSITDGASSFNVNSLGESGLALTLSANQLAVISDCAKNYVFQISSVSGTSPAVINHVSASNLNSSSAFVVPQGSFYTGAEVAPANTIVYFIGIGSDGDAALFRGDLLSNPSGPTAFFPVELVPDIENMQVLYGVDATNGTTNAVNQYLTADQVTDFNKVMSVKVAVLSASPMVQTKNTGPAALTKVPTTAISYSLLGTTVKAPKDTRLRRVFEINIAVRNAVN